MYRYVNHNLLLQNSYSQSHSCDINSPQKSFPLLLFIVLNENEESIAKAEPREDNAMLIKKHSTAGCCILDHFHSVSASRFVLLLESSECLCYSDTLLPPHPIRQQSKTNDIRPYHGPIVLRACVLAVEERSLA